MEAKCLLPATSSLTWHPSKNSANRKSLENLGCHPTDVVNQEGDFKEIFQTYRNDIPSLYNWRGSIIWDPPRYCELQGTAAPLYSSERGQLQSEGVTALHQHWAPEVGPLLNDGLS